MADIKSTNLSMGRIDDGGRTNSLTSRPDERHSRSLEQRSDPSTSRNVGQRSIERTTNAVLMSSDGHHARLKVGQMLVDVTSDSPLPRFGKLQFKSTGTDQQWRVTQLNGSAPSQPITFTMNVHPVDDIRLTDSRVVNAAKIGDSLQNVRLTLHFGLNNSAHATQLSVDSQLNTFQSDLSAIRPEGKPNGAHGQSLAPPFVNRSFSHPPLASQSSASSATSFQTGGSLHSLSDGQLQGRLDETGVRSTTRPINQTVAVPEHRNVSGTTSIGSLNPSGVLANTASPDQSVGSLHGSIQTTTGKSNTGLTYFTVSSTAGPPIEKAGRGSSPDLRLGASPRPQSGVDPQRQALLTTEQSGKNNAATLRTGIIEGAKSPSVQMALSSYHSAKNGIASQLSMPENQLAQTGTSNWSIPGKAASSIGLRINDTASLQRAIVTETSSNGRLVIDNGIDQFEVLDSDLNLPIGFSLFISSAQVGGALNQQSNDFVQALVSQLFQDVQTSPNNGDRRSGAHVSSTALLSLANTILFEPTEARRSRSSYAGTIDGQRRITGMLHEDDRDEEETDIIRIVDLGIPGTQGRDPSRLGFASDDRTDNQGPNDEPKSRFVVELELTALHRLQIDCLANDKEYSIVLRSADILDAGISREIAEIFHSACEITGADGQVSYSQRFVGKDQPR